MKRNILVLSSLYNYHQLTQFIQYLSAYRRLSRHNYYFHNFVYDFDPKRIDFDRFDAVMVPHNFWPLNLSEEQIEAFSKTRALKMVFLQDEYQEVNTIADIFGRMKIDLVFTCVNPEDHDVFYPQRRIPSLKGVHQVLTGYVDDALRKPGLFTLDNKTIDVGFRGRVSPFFLGELGYQKQNITEMFADPARKAGLKVNISVNESDRLSGDRWLDFLQSCRTQLGTPSGSSVIDFNGRIIKETASYRRAFPRADFKTVRKDVFSRQDGRFSIDTISPRMLEAAATGSAMVQLEGRYGGFMAAGEHYIELKRDYSNIPEVIAQIKDDDLVKRIATSAYEHFIESGNFDFERHIAKFDDLIDRHLQGRAYSQTPSKRAFYQEQISLHQQNFTICPDGVEWFNTLPARRMRRNNAQRDALRNHKLLGRMLKKAGGDPMVKHAKGRVALELIKAFSAYRNLVAAAYLVPGVSVDAVLREIFILGIIQANQLGVVRTGTIFTSRLVEHGDGDIVIETRCPGQKDSDFADADISKLRFSADDEDALWVDFRKTFPMGDLASTLIVPVKIEQDWSDIRSDPYMRYPLDAIRRIGRFMPFLVRSVLREALDEPKQEERSRDALRRAFEKSVTA